MDETYKPKCEAKWDALFNQTFNWKSIWESINETLCSNKEKQFQWKIIHNAIFTEHKLQLMNFSNGLSHFCKAHVEDIRHLFYNCSISHDIVRQIEGKLNTVLNEYDETLELDTHHIILGYTDGTKISRSFINFCILVLKWELWKIRNKVKFENRRYTANESVKLIIQKIKDATDFIAMTRVSERNEKVLNMLKKLE